MNVYIYVLIVGSIFATRYFCGFESTMLIGIAWLLALTYSKH